MDYLALLKQLEEEVSTVYGDNWVITLMPDGSGELICPNETPLIIFQDYDHLKACVEALSESEKTLHINEITDILHDMDY